MNRADRNALKHLAATAGRYVSASDIPNGHGHVVRTGATGDTLKRLRGLGWIEYGREPTHSLYGYRITDAGLAALRSTSSPA